MKLGISTASFFSKSETEDSLALIKSMGIDICEVFLTTFREYREEFIDILEERKGNLEIYSIHTLNQQFEPELFNVSARTREDCEFFFRQAARAAGRLGASSYTFHGPARLKKIPYKFNYEWIGQCVDHLDDILAEETDGKCKLAYENVHWTYFSEPEFFIELKKRTPVTCCLDIKQAMQSKIPLDLYIDCMWDRLKNVHLCDFFPDGTLALPGKGTFDFTSLFRKLLERGYQGPAMLELYAKNYDGFDEVKRSYEYLQNCLTEAQKG